MITLPIKKVWFNMIASGEKGEEYRNETPHYKAIFDKRIGVSTKVKFRNGYRRDSPSIIRTVIPRYGIGRPEWGAESGKKYIVLEIMP